MQPEAAAIAIVGNINLDVKAGPIPADPRLMADGETSVKEIYETIGGGGANTAVAAAIMGGDVHFVGATGADALGERLRRFLESHGITAHLAAKAAPTGRSLALSWEGNQRHFLSCLPSALLLEAEDVDVAALAASGCRHLYRADLWFAPRLLAGGNAHLLRQARRLGMETSIDVNWDPHWHAGWDDAGVRERISDVARMLPEVIYAHGNERELCFFAARPALHEAARWFFDQGVQTLIVHRGPAGSAALSADGASADAPAEPVTNIVSEAGTGDVFTAAFLLRDGMEMGQRLRECNALAARHLSGATLFLPRLEG